MIGDPRRALAAEGIAVPEDVEITVTCDSESQVHVILGAETADAPVKPLPEAPDFRSVCAHVDARCRRDPAFKARFLADPAGTIRGLGCALPAGTDVSVHVSRPDHAYFNLPRPPRAQLDAAEADDGETLRVALYFPIPLVHGGPTGA